MPVEVFGGGGGLTAVVRAGGTTPAAAALPFFNVTDYGAPNSTSLQAAITAAANSGGGSVVLPAGIFTVTGQVNVPYGIRIQGQGRGVTVLRGGVSSGATLSFEGTSSSPVSAFVSDFDIDLQNVASASAIGHYYVSGLRFERVGFLNTAFKYGQTYVSSQSTFDNNDITFSDCYFGPSTATGTTEAITLANTNRVRFDRCLWAVGTQTDVLLYQLTDDVVFRDCWFDTAPVYSVSCNNIVFENCQLPAGINGANLSDHGAFGYTYVDGLTTRNCVFGGPLDLGSTRGYRDERSTFYKCPQQAVAFNPTAGQAQGYDSKFTDTVFRDNNTTSSSWGVFYLPNTTINLGLDLDGCLFDDDQATQTQGTVFNLASAVSYQGVRATNCKIRGGANMPYTSAMYGGSGTLGSGCRISQVAGFNPLGSTSFSQPPVPASGTAYINAFGSDFTVYIDQGSVTQIKTEGATIAATGGTFRVPAGQSIILTYTSAPVWTWIGD